MSWRPARITLFHEPYPRAVHSLRQRRRCTGACDFNACRCWQLVKNGADLKSMGGTQFSIASVRTPVKLRPQVSGDPFAALASAAIFELKFGRNNPTAWNTKSRLRVNLAPVSSFSAYDSTACSVNPTSRANSRSFALGGLALLTRVAQRKARIFPCCNRPATKNQAGGVSMNFPWPSMARVFKKSPSSTALNGKSCAR